MSTQSEAALEAGLIATLRQMDYEYVQIVEATRPPTPRQQRRPPILPAPPEKMPELLTATGRPSPMSRSRRNPARSPTEMKPSPLTLPTQPTAM